MKKTKTEKKPADEIIHIRIPAAEKALIVRAAEQDDRSLTQWARRTLVAAAGDQLRDGTQSRKAGK